MGDIMNKIQTNIPANVGDLQVIYEQCNEHLREGDRKRDQTLAFFTALLGVFIGNSSNILNGFNNRLILLSILHFIFFIAGIFLANVLIEYRLWHLKYTLSGQVLQKLMFMTRNTATKSDIQSILKKTIYRPSRKKLIQTTESMILNIFITVNFINVIYFCHIDFSKVKSISFLLVVYILYMAYFNERNYRSINTFYEHVQQEKASIWILDLVYTEESSPEDELVYSNNYYDIKVKNNIPKLYDKLGGVVIIPLTVDNKFILIEIERPLVQETSLEFPRGFKELDETFIQAADRELLEEIGVTAPKYEYLGGICPNNGLLSSMIGIVLASQINIDAIKLQKEEKIIGIRYVTLSELKSLMKEEITDGFTLASIVKWENQ